MESRLNLYKAGLTLDQIESKSSLLHSGLTITKAAKVIERDNIDDTNEVTDELVEIEANEDEMSLYPTYIVDQNTGEILFVEEISDNQRVGISDAPDDFHTHCVEDSSKAAQRDESRNEDDSTAETHSKEDMSVWVVGSEESDIKECLEEEYEEEEDDEDGSVDGDTGPLDGRIMQILPDDTGGDNKDVCIAEDVVQIIQLNQEKEQDEDQDPVDGDLGKEYVLEDGVLR